MSDSSKRPPRLILASSSRYRRELLERLRVPFDVVVPALDETPLAGETPEATALRLAEAKARAVAAGLPAGEPALVIGSDQVATYDGLQIGKPGTHEKALAQLQAMRGREVLFHSALCLFDRATDHAQTIDVITRVRFRNLPDAALDAYLRAETPYDVAGSAKSEGLGIALLEAIHSDDPTALVGLPLIALTSMLLAAGYPLLETQ
ncbi:septum formation protein Maf [Burkholderia sp. SRS-W-2-2016]|uniref:Maf-like protein n=1 Tax=Burkholderia sp. SRS-W-2-2016 TaxID=1926878 RepID=UPI00094B3EB5|nr:Maf-like protein [Burkholderia sp. SRS-W-2-2016]OLL30227.1 septum formation protein Maf [Burkholderia sp. SRS-W-2-2016]